MIHQIAAEPQVQLGEKSRQFDLCPAPDFDMACSQ